MKCRNRRPDHLSYTIEEVARLLEVHRNTNRDWIKGGLPVIDGKHPALILGNELAEFLATRRAARRQTCQPEQMYCVKCRKPTAEMRAAGPYGISGRLGFRFSPRYAASGRHHSVSQRHS
jgi:hypothetical protein